MKKTAIILGVAIGILIILWFVGRATHAFTMYTIPSEANEPSIKRGSRVFVSRFKEPERFDFICFRADLETQGPSTVLFRLCGMPGDVIEIRDGDLFVNGVFADRDLDLLHTYVIPSSDFPKIQDSVDVNQLIAEGDSLRLSLGSHFVLRHGLNARKSVLDRSFADEGIGKKFKPRWNGDHFGPVTVPRDHYFVLGDNRHGAQDSRYLGFIPKDQFVATVLD